MKDQGRKSEDQFEEKPLNLVENWGRKLEDYWQYIIFDRKSKDLYNWKMMLNIYLSQSL